MNRRVCALPVVLAAPSIISGTWDQQEEMPAEIGETTGRNSYTDNFSALIDIVGGYQFQT